MATFMYHLFQVSLASDDSAPNHCCSCVGSVRIMADSLTFTTAVPKGPQNLFEMLKDERYAKGRSLINEYVFLT